MRIKKQEMKHVILEDVLNTFSSDSASKAGSAYNDKVLYERITDISAITLQANNATDFFVDFTGAYTDRFVLNFDRVYAQVGTGLVNYSNGVKVNNSKITHIRLQACVEGDLNANIQTRFLKNGVVITGSEYDTPSITGLGTAHSRQFIVECSLNDVFTFDYSASVAGNRRIRGSRSFFTVEQVNF